MRTSGRCGVLAALGMAVTLTLAPAMAQGPGDAPAVDAVEAPWQTVITNQIQAFRDHDAPTAFSYAGAGFQVTFENAEVFFQTIINSGYAPIMESRSHSFGVYQLIGESGVIQEVRLVGKEQELYTAIYQLTEEEVGWRVQAVQLVRQAGVAI